MVTTKTGIIESISTAICLIACSIAPTVTRQKGKSVECHLLARSILKCFLVDQSAIIAKQSNQ